MKKQFLLFLLFVAIGAGTMAQQSSSAFSKGDNLLNAGIGLGSPFFGAGYTSAFPFNPGVSYERGITDAISVGGQISYARSKYSYAIYGSDYYFKESALYVGARGAYHFNELLDLDSKFDVYGGATAGYVIVSVNDNAGHVGSAASAPGYGIFAGGKYFFRPNTSVYAELGYQSLSFLNVGISFKF
jgi:Outer membrane protein beta-barrel domain